LIQQMRDQGARVICVMTSSAKHFVTPLVLRALSGQRVYQDEDFFSSETPYDVLHTTLAEEASVVLIAPASADLIARMAAGMANDLATCILLATGRPVLIAPAMNDQMYGHRITQQNIQKLKDNGCRFIDPVEGHLVCGKEALGHIAGPDEIVQQLQKILSAQR
jgi:phosphopantothenoylcysteine decarboxylase/phosphopantothenate--cysteine ligase